MAAGVAVNDVDLADLRHVVLLQVGAEDAGDARIEARAEQGRQTRLLEGLLIRPLPPVLELCGLFRFVVRGVEVIHAGCETGVHDVQILIGQGHVDHKVGAMLLEQGYCLRHVVGIDPGGRDGTGKLRCDRVAFILSARGNHDLFEYLGDLRTFVGNDRTDTAGADDHDF